MGTNECSQSASKSSWDSQDFGDVNMVLKMVHFDHNELIMLKRFPHNWHFGRGNHGPLVSGGFPS